MIKLKTCPMCGKDHAEIRQQAPTEKYFYVVCRECYLRTDYYLTREFASNGWNKRAERSVLHYLDEISDFNKSLTQAEK